MGSSEDDAEGIANVRVRCLNDVSAPASGKHIELVLYWMQMYRRPDDNAALNYAIERANELGLPCVVYEALRPDYPFASDRFHTFVLESACDVAEGLRARGLRHVFFLPKTADEARGVLVKLATRAALVVTDDYPTFLIPEQSAALAKRVTCPIYAVDDNVLAPLALFPKDELGARTLRPKLARVEATWCRPLVEPKPRVPPAGTLTLPFVPTELSLARVPALVAGCAIDHTVPAVLDLKGGAVAALARARGFLAKKLGGYAVDRNDPSCDGTSGLSPYLHFGMLSSRKLTLLAKDARESEGRAAFLEQLVVRRGLAYTFARNNPHHREYAGLPAWARKTLAEHASDARPALVSLRDLTDARSPDALWNAAQLELRARGVIHGYARMLWGKLPLTWMQQPSDVHAALVHLNDRFALDGRDPDGYTNIGWCLGLHDRPWPSRAIFGSVRCMTSKSARTKLDFEGYIEGWNARRRELV